MPDVIPAAIPSSFANDRFHCSAELYLELCGKAREFIFVLGCARSGTTIVADILNQQPDMFMLYEDNPFLNVQRTDYADWYNAMQLGDGRPPAKGVYLPSFGAHRPGWAYVYAMLKRQFVRCGSKIALGPHGLWNDIEATLLDFFGSFFHHARYVLTLRSPGDNIVSMARMFQDRTLAELLETWTLSLLYTVELAACFPHALLIRNELVDAPYLARLSAFTGLDLVFDPELVRFRSLDGGLDIAAERALLSRAFPDAPAALTSALDQAYALHHTVTAAFHKDTGTLRDAVHRVELARQTACAVKALCAGLRAL